MALLVEVAEYRNHLIRQRIPSSYFYLIHGSGLAGHTLVPVRSSTSEPWLLQNFTPMSVVGAGYVQCRAWRCLRFHSGHPLFGYLFPFLISDNFRSSRHSLG